MKPNKLHWVLLVLILAVFPAPAKADCDLWTASWGTETVTTVASQTECDALIDLKASTGVSNWTNNSGWIYGTPLTGHPTDPCAWYGVTCNSSGVTHLIPYNNNLIGPIPSSLGNLSNLTYLRISENQLTGPIPSELGDLSSLTYLDLNYNQLTGPIPSSLGNLSNLTTLLLITNQLTGPIPSSLGNLNNLTGLYLTTTQLTGPIPSSLGKLSNLESLFLDGNQLTGPIPAELGNLSNLTFLNLSGNDLTGPIPFFLGNLGNLNYLSLSRNQLVGPIPSSLGNLGSLEQFHLTQNLLHGDLTVPLNGLRDTVTSLTLSDGWRNNDCFTTTDSSLSIWLDSNDNGPDWDECEADSDSDGVDGVNDNCPTVANANQANCDNDDYGDVCDFVDDDPAIFFPIKAKNGKTAVTLLGGDCP